MYIFRILFAIIVALNFSNHSNAQQVSQISQEEKKSILKRVTEAEIRIYGEGNIATKSIIGQLGDSIQMIRCYNYSPINYLSNFSYSCEIMGYLNQLPDAEIWVYEKLKEGNEVIAIIEGNSIDFSFGNESDILNRFSLFFNFETCFIYRISEGLNEYFVYSGGKSRAVLGNQDVDANFYLEKKYSISELKEKFVRKYH